MSLSMATTWKSRNLIHVILQLPAGPSRLVIEGNASSIVALATLQLDAIF